MYKSVLFVSNSPIGGKGLFSKAIIPSNTSIMEIKGDLFNNSQIADHSNMIQIDADAFLGPSGDIDDYINHSCDPNCYLHIVGRRAILYSLYQIPEGGEITIDYSVNSTNQLSEWQMNCNCCRVGCRKLISGIDYVNDEALRSFREKKIVPTFIKRYLKDK